MGGCNTLWGSFTKVASRGAACWQWMREAVFSAGLKRRAWWARSRGRQRKTARIRYSGNLSAVGGENSQRPDYSQWDTLAQTGDILGKSEKDFWGSAEPSKNTLRARERPARISRVVLGFWVSRRGKLQKCVGTQFKDPLDVCCCFKDFLLKSHSNYRILTVNKLAGGRKVRGERLLEPTNLSRGAFWDFFFKLEGNS